MQLKDTKTKLTMLKEEILEGVKIRARIKEQLEGENSSSSILGKISKTIFKPMISKIET